MEEALGCGGWLEKQFGEKFKLESHKTAISLLYFEQQKLGVLASLSLTLPAQSWACVFALVCVHGAQM